MSGAVERLDAVVIGAGLSGLAAALALEAAGARVQVVEAQQRVGGRVHSMRQLGTHAEAGATYIGAGYTRVLAAAARFGIRLIDVTPAIEFFREQDLVLGGRIIRQAEWPAHPANPFPEHDKQLFPWNYHRVLTMRANPLPTPAAWLDPEYARYDVPLHDWFAALGLSERAIALAYMNSSFGRDARDVSALMLLFRAAFSKVQRGLAPSKQLGFTVEAGVQHIPEAMAAALAREIELGSVVRSISLERTAATVRCANGRALRAARVVAAVSFGALRRIAIDPPLEGAQAAAVRELPAQSVTQVYLTARAPFWEHDGYAPSLYTDSLAGMLGAVRNGATPNEITGLTAWLMGPTAERLHGLSAAEVGRRVIADVERIRPAARGKLELVGVQAWGADPYVAGAWAYFRPGDVGRFAAVMGRPHGRLHFCGEHLARTSRGLEGAMASGEQAAAEVLAAC
jgi:monoamine oxidase